MTQQLKIEAGKYYRTRDGRKVGPMRDDWYSSEHPIHCTEMESFRGILWRRDGVNYTGHHPEFDLTAEWQDDQPEHIVICEGRIYDLTALETPLGLLPAPVQEALRTWPHGRERYSSANWVKDHEAALFNAVTYRAKPAPANERVRCYRGYNIHEHGTCIKRPDGSIDWATWEPEDG